MPDGFEMYPYAPRSTQQTLFRQSFRRLPIPAGTGPLPCRFCAHPVYRVMAEPAYVTDDGIEVSALWDIIDASPDVAGVAPTAMEGGSGIHHGHVCEVPRPLPLVAKGELASRAPRPERPTP